MGEAMTENEQDDTTEGLSEEMKQEVARMLQEMLGGKSFEETLEALDPRDSDAALAMLNWLLHNQRLHRVGVLDDGQGYLFIYQEPKGASKEGYRPGGTQGDRLVDKALEKQKETGAKPVQRGMCRACFSVVAEIDGVVKLVDSTSETPDVCDATGGAHDLATP